MGAIYTFCPVTGQAIATGIETDAESFARTPAFTGRVFCPRCQREHEWSKDKAWVESDDRGGPEK